ncbi:MipA/OmpV family protein [Amantichitinum ursilacus]|uniref:MltA-interacting protein MipA n=1 Tax=Amantichitinum ursilacus TaxID=857265 RepID=A0A0N0GR12_9NEIS|nr:MipA/OmpV family protein [Amantichitinum ursilacus]KPC55251.1 MltA-interacting protein MipA [Amantichitinum ursilacus]
MRNLIRILFCVCMSAAGLAHAAIDLPDLPNLAGVGVGVTTQCTGCKDTLVGVMPALEYHSEHYTLEWYGPVAQLDLGAPGSSFRWGPVLGIRLGRSDLDDPVLDALPGIHNTMEGGAFVGYEYLHAGGVPYRVRLYTYVMTNAGQEYTGARGSVYGSVWLPASPRILLGAGLGYGWGSHSFMNTYYGVSSAGAAASGLPAFDAHGGSQQVYGWLGAVVRVAPKWFVGVGVIEQRLIAAAADTPIVTQRGTPNQLTYGAGVGYSF